MSLNSRRLNDAINNKNNVDFNSEIDELDIFVFDTLEILNGIFFSENDACQQKCFVEEIIHKLETDFISISTNKKQLIRCSSKHKDMKPYILAVYTEYFTNTVFERHCKNQVFQNLQPKFKRLSVNNNKSNLIELLIPFLLVEVSLFLFIYHKGEYSKIFGMEREMNIISSIKEKKYSAFNKFLENEIIYIQIPTQEYA